MGDDDVICLSSDDETTPGESSKTKSKKLTVDDNTVKNEIHSPPFCNKTIKRKAETQTINKTTNIEAKKTKVDGNGSIEEIIIASPAKTTQRESINADLVARIGKSFVGVNSSLPVISRNSQSRRSDVSANESRGSSKYSDISLSLNRSKHANEKNHELASTKSRHEKMANDVKNFFAKPNISRSNREKLRTSRVLPQQNTETRQIETPGNLEIGQKRENSDSSRSKIENYRRRVEKPFDNETNPQPVRSRSPTVTLFHKNHEKTAKITVEKVAMRGEKISTKSSDDWTRSVSNLPEVRITPRFDKSINSGVKTTGDNNIANGRTNLSSGSKDSNSKHRDSSCLKILQKTDSRNSGSTKIIQQPRDTTLKSNDTEKSAKIFDKSESPKAHSLKHYFEVKTRERTSSNSSRDESVRKSESPRSEKSPKFGTPKTSNRQNSSDDAKSDDSSRTFTNSKSIHTSRAQSMKYNDEKISPRINDFPIRRDSTKSPEVEIVDRIESPKSSRSKNSLKFSSSLSKIFGKSANGQCSSESSSRESTSKTKIGETQNTDFSTIRTEITRKEEKLDSISCNTYVSSSVTDVLRIMEKIDDPSVDISKIDENSKRDSAPEKSKSNLIEIPIIKKPAVVVRRISPTKISKLLSPSKTKSDLSRSEVSNSRNDESKKSSRSNDEREMIESFEPIAGCSKTPDVTCSRKEDDNRKKSSLIGSFMEKPWKSSTSNDVLTQKSERSKSSDDDFEDSEKPRLIVKRKKPVDSNEQDKFAMFLGLCLQTDRSIAMEKIVAKLKRNYEQMDPYYAKSRAFCDLIDEKREKIIAKGRVYWYIGQVAEEMKIRKKRGVSSIKSRDKETTKDSAMKNDNDEDARMSNDDNDNDENSEESRRLRKKIKTIEIAMKKCSKRIRELETAEVDFDEDVNSDYIKLDRYKEKMVQLYTKMCEYTNEHADAGRAYLRPQHLRVTQIPSIDQAINSFVNSKLSHNRKKLMAGKSIVDGLVFPDYVDILECVGRVNDEQKLGLDKRRQQQLAQDAFTQLGRHLQNARQKDYWDTFSLDLENGEDPATVDHDLSVKLKQNQEIADKNTREIFEEYVRKQEEGNTENHHSSENDNEDEDEDDDDDDDDDGGGGGEDDEKNSVGASDVERSENEVEENPDESDNENSKDLETIQENDVNHADVENEHVIEIWETISEPESPKESICQDIEDSVKELRIEEPTIDSNNILVSSNTKIDDRVETSDRQKDISIEKKTMVNKETIPEAEISNESLGEDIESRVSEVRIEDTTTSENNNVLEKCETKKNDSTDRSEEIPIVNETTEISVNHAEPDTEVSMNEPVIEQPTILRIRSFAKPPSSWASSQEIVTEKTVISSIPETTNSSRLIKVIDEESKDKTSTLILENITDPLRIDRPLTFNSKNVVISKMDKNMPKITRTTKPQPLSASINRSSIVVRSPNQSSSSSSSSSSSLSSNIVKTVSNSSAYVSKQLSILPNRKIAPLNGQITQNSLRQAANVINSMIPGPLRNHSVIHNIKIPITSTNPVNVRVRSLDSPQRVQVKVAKHIRPLTAGQLQVIRLSSANTLARANTIEVTSPMQQRTLTTTTNQIRFPTPVSQNNQIVQVSSRPVNSLQQVRIRVAGNSQLLQNSHQQQQILRLSNGQCITAATATIRPLDTSSTSQITLRNPRIITFPTVGATNTTTTVARSTNNGQMRVERIDNSPQRNTKSSNREDSIVSGQVSQTGQRTIPVLKQHTSNNTPSSDEHRRSSKRPGQKDSWLPPDVQPPSCKK